MPILGVMSETFESEGGSIKGDEDFFSVASTMPFVAVTPVSKCAGDRSWDLCTFYA